ncbi:MAG: rhomboid family intramembrane serine protease [Pirellulales bacterium]
MLFPLYDNNSTRRWPILTLLLIVANVVVHFCLAKQPAAVRSELYARYGFVPKRIQQFQDPKLVVAVPIEQAHDPQAVGPLLGPAAPPQTVELKSNQEEILISLLSCMFLHGGWLHLASNMWFLWLFGNNIEDRLGHVVFVLFYLTVGLLASACHWATNQDSILPIVGASGAVAGVLGAYAITFPAAKVKTIIFLGFIFILDLPALLVLFGWFGIQIWMGFQAIGANVGQVAWWAHVGGFIAGVVIMPLLSAGAPEPGTHWEDEAEREFQGN